MTPELARRAEEIFLELAPLPPDAWEAQLDARCGADHALRAEVASLLQFHARAQTFLDPAEVLGPAHLAADAPPPAEPELRPGQRLGEYVIDRAIGAGGMGTVYIAAQDRPRRTVALKVIRRRLAADSLLRRFEAEAELHGRLQHPGIAQIFEAGAAPVDTQGPRLPFIAMELIDGPTLTAYCDARRLDTPARIELLAKVCDAVHHAHQRGVIHRDLKPANILVDAAGQPKVLDFGVARAADADLRVTTLQTSVGQLIGTLPYMSPEQVAGDPRELDTRSDVYALGVLLFELLTGRLPHDLSSRSLPEAARVIREEPHTRLSSISRIYRGEIETIVAKALEKDKDRRYQSAAELAEDLRRFVRGEPILARQNSSLYVLRKQMTRYRWVLRAASAAIIALLILTLVASRQARTQTFLAARERQARAEADLARTRADTQRAQAEAARARADALGQQLAVELSRLRIELGRLEGVVRHMPLAERTLWSEHFRHPGSAPAHWALWELYDRFPSLWTRRTDGPVAAGALSDGGALLLAALRSGAVAIYDARTGANLAVTPPLDTPILSLAASDCAVYVGLQDGAIARLSLDPLADEPAPSRLADDPAHPGGVRALALSPDGAALASAGADGSIQVWSTDSHTPVRRWQAHTDAAALAYHPRRGTLASAPRHAGPSSPIRIWDPASGALLRELPFPVSAAPSSIAFLDDPPRLLAGDHERRLFVFDLESGAVTNPRPFFKGPVVNVRPSPRGDRFLITAGDSPIIFDAATLAPVFEHGVQHYAILNAGWTSDDAFTLLCYDGVARSLGARPSPATTTARVAPRWSFGLDIDPGGTTLAVAGSDSSLHILDLVTLRPRIALSIAPADRARALKFIPADDRRPLRLLAADARGRIQILDPSTGDLLATLRGPTSEIYSLALHPDARRVAAGHADGRLILWDLDSASPIFEFPRQPRRIEGLAFSPGGDLLAASGHPGAVTLWHTDSGRHAATLETSAMPWGVAFTPDGRTLLASLYRGGVDALDPAGVTPRRTVQAHQRLVPALALSPDGALFATGSEDGDIKLWETATLTRLASFEPGAGEIITAAFDPTSRYLAASSASGLAVRIDLHSSLSAIRANEPYHRLLIEPGPDPARAAADAPAAAAP